MSRGMVKWNAFNALVDQGERLTRMKVDRQRQPQPTLSQQQKDMLDQILQEASKTKTPVRVKYYDAGFFHQMDGVITAIEPLERAIKIDKKRYFVSQIVAIEWLKED